uniref:Phenoloxidase-activating factor 2 n=1 Tax=Drosophila rhopaloa TaxID=1041015 RepID=A0A6P4ET10_DRORH
MGHFWTTAALILSCILLGEACNSCVSREVCLKSDDINSVRCAPHLVCCEILHEYFTWDLTGNNNEPERSTTAEPIIPYPGFRTFRTEEGLSIPFGLSTDGLSNPNGLDATKYMTNEQSRPGQFPWVMALFDTDKYFAGGSLIRSDVVLTAAHKLRNKYANQIVVRAGEWDMGCQTESFSYDEREVYEITLHENFEFKTGANNVALLFLTRPFVLNNHIRIIPIPEPGNSYDGRRCTVAGWGKTKESDLDNSSILKKVELPMLRRDQCEEQLRRTRLGWNFKLPESFVCAGGEPGKDACLGDGGSPLFCAKGQSDRYEQVGIVTWGMGCGVGGVPATYTNVAMFNEWINEKMLPFVYRKGQATVSPVR